MVAPPKPVDIPLGQAVERYLDTLTSRVATGSLAPSTLTGYTADLNHLTRIIDPATLCDHITGEDIDAALVAFANTPDARYNDPTTKPGAGQSLGSQQRFRATIDGFFTHATHHAWVQMSPMQWATLNPTPRGGLRVARTSLSVEQAAALLTYGAGPEPAPDDHRATDMWLRDKFLIAALTVVGVRVSELCAANLNDFTIRDGVETWRVIGKGGKVRHVPLSAWLSDLKRNYLTQRPQHGKRVGGKHAAELSRKRLCLTTNGSPLTERDVQRLLGRAYLRVLTADPSNARELTPHALRHTCATVLLASGWDIKLVAQLLGHASLSTTGIYLDELPGELALAIAKHPLTQPPT